MQTSMSRTTLVNTGTLRARSTGGTTRLHPDFAKNRFRGHKMKAFIKHVKNGKVTYGDSAFTLEETVFKVRNFLVACSDGEEVQISVLEREHKES
jgi:hypothetical protein